MRLFFILITFFEMELGMRSDSLPFLRKRIPSVLVALPLMQCEEGRSGPLFALQGRRSSSPLFLPEEPLSRRVKTGLDSPLL